jgi:hypothetical protein
MKSGKSLKSVVSGRVAALLFLCAAVSVPAAVINENGVKASGEGGEGSSPPSLSAGASGFFERLGAPARKTVAVSLASSYDPNFNVSSLLGSTAAIYDHGYLWDGINSGNTGFKLEAVAGSIFRPELRTLASLNMMALYYPRLLPAGGFRPYLEGGIGVIYTDYRVNRQPYRFNFNPQLGIGTEISGRDDSRYFIALRLHHISNCSTNRDNQGVNSLQLQLGRYF